MKKNGYLRKFIAMFLVFVMLMADSSMTTFAEVVGREMQQNADEENGIDLQSADDGKLAAGKYGNYTLSYNGTKNAFTADTKYAKYYNTQSPLGVAGSFHIVAFDTARLNAHTNGNILANTLIAGSNFGTNSYPDELSYAVRYQQVNSTSASSSSHTLVVGSNNTIATVDNNNVLSVNGTKIDKPQNLIVDNDSTATPFIDLTDVKDEITNKSAALARVANTAVTANFSDQNNRSLTLTNPDYAGYYNMTAAELNALSGNPLKMMGFKSGHDGSIIVNVDCSGVSKVNMPQKACVYIDGNEQSTNEVTTFENGKVIWNFVNATGVKINTQQMTGMVIAPGATVNVNQNLNGTVVAENVNINAESHRTDFTGVTTPAEVEADGTKTVDGKEPTSTQKFDFELAESTVTFNNENEALASDQWKNVETVQNNGSKINFSNLNYSKDSDIGTHWYKVSEKSDVSNTSYTYDNTVYLMKVVVTKTNNVFNADKTYYRVENNQASSTDKIQFNNTTVQQKGDLKIVKAASTGTDLDGKTFFFKVTDSNGNIVKNGESDVWSITYGDGAESSVTITDLEPGNYTVAETDQKGNEVTTDDSFPYTVSGNGNVKVEAKNTVFITVTNTKKMVSVSGSKTWNVPEGTTLPESITVILKQNGEVYDTKTVTAADDWNYSFTDLDKYDADGNEYTYSVDEEAVAGYNKAVDGFNITNTKSDKIDVSGSKTWNVPEGTILPESITVILNQNGKEYDTKTVTAADGWKYEWKDLPAYSPDGKTAYTYSIDEADIEGYTKSVAGYDLINTITGKTEVSGTKTWKAPEGTELPESITVILNQNGKEYDTKTVTEADGWKYEWKDLPLYSADGKTTYTYSIDEEDVEGYNKAVDGNDLINTITGTTEVSGIKTWKAPEGTELPESITVILNQNGKEYDTKTVTEADGWKYEWKDLPLYSADGKTAYTYSIDEEDVEGYNKTVDGNDLINTITGKTKVEGIKTWNDSDNQDGIRPDSITVNLFANGVKVKSWEVTAANDWKYTFDDLDKYENGKEIIYTVSEDLVKGYTASVNDYDITNTHEAETTEISGTKSWNDGDNQDGIRPDTITVNLLADGTKVKSQEVTPDENGNWTYSFTDLPKYADGEKITYTVTEEAVEGYETTVNGYNILNTHKPETISIDGTKHWDDANNQDGKRPESIKVRLLANGTEVAEKDVTAVDDWTYSFTDLPKFADSKEIIYTVTEDTVTDYTTVIDGTTITNSYTPGKTSITVTKAWADNDNQDGIRPDSIKVQLYAGDTAQGKEVTLSEDNNWTYTWSELDAKKDGQDIVYTVRETEVPAGYKVTVAGSATEGFILTNTHEAEVISVEGTKTWDDSDQIAKRPESITVRLLADGKEVSNQKVTADSNWTYKFTELPKYAAGKAIVYTVSEDAVPGYITSVSGTNIINKITSIKISKVDVTDQKELEGAHIQVLDKDGNVVDEWDSTKEAHEVKGLKTGEQYTLRETVAPDGYAITSDTTFSLKADGTVDKDNTTTTVSDNGTLLVEDSRTSIKISKVDVTDQKELEGAHIQVLDKDGNVVDEWDSTKEAHEVKGLKTGEQYTLRETVAPDGYAITSDTTFSLKADGTVDKDNTTTTVSDNGTLLVEDSRTSIKISKVDVTDQKELAGAHIQILDKDGNLIEEWDSTWNAHEVTGLKTGEQYTLRETVAPDGYTITSDTTFSLKADGTVDKDNTSTTVSEEGTLLVEDTKTSVSISKVDVADGKELEGAHIQILDEDENIVDEWDSTKEAHEVKGLKTGKKYTLRETVAPTGYELTTDTTFVLKEDGTVDKDNTTTTSKDGILLVQDKLATGQSIAVTKKLTTATGDLKAMDQTFYVALYSDEACTQRVSDVKAIEFKNASSSTVVFNENIEVNKDYYIAECTQDGTAQSIGALADGTMYEAKFNDGNKAVVKEANGTTTVYFDNVFTSLPDGFYKQGKLTITKKLLGADGKAKKSESVFYAGIFDDEAHTQLSTQVSQNIVKLDLAGGSEVSQVIKIGLDENKAVTLYVTETDSNGKPVEGNSGFAYTVSVEGSTVTIDEANENASVTITNTENPTTATITPAESEKESSSSASSHSMSSSTKAPKTGDNTPIAMYVIILIAAAALIVFGFGKRRKKNK